MSFAATTSSEMFNSKEPTDSPLVRLGKSTTGDLSLLAGPFSPGSRLASQLNERPGTEISQQVSSIDIPLRLALNTQPSPTSIPSKTVGNKPGKYITLQPVSVEDTQMKIERVQFMIPPGDTPQKINSSTGPSSSPNVEQNITFDSARGIFFIPSYENLDPNYTDDDDNFPVRYGASAPEAMFNPLISKANATRVDSTRFSVSGKRMFRYQYLGYLRRAGFKIPSEENAPVTEERWNSLQEKTQESYSLRAAALNQDCHLKEWLHPFKLAEEKEFLEEFFPNVSFREDLIDPALGHGEHLYVCLWRGCRHSRHATKEKLFDHVYSEHVEKMSAPDFDCKWQSCNNNGRTHDRSSWLKWHLLEHVQPEYSKCFHPRCEERFTSTVDRINHMREVHRYPQPVMYWDVGKEDRVKAYARYDLEDSVKTTPRSKKARENYVDLPIQPPYTAHLANLSFDTNEKDIVEFFKDLQITQARIVLDNPATAPERSAYVDFATQHDLRKLFSDSYVIVASRATDWL